MDRSFQRSEINCSCFDFRTISHPVLAPVHLNAYPFTSAGNYQMMKPYRSRTPKFASPVPKKSLKKNTIRTNQNRASIPESDPNPNYISTVRYSQISNQPSNYNESESENIPYYNYNNKNNYSTHSTHSTHNNFYNPNHSQKNKKKNNNSVRYNQKDKQKGSHKDSSNIYEEPNYWKIQVKPEKTVMFVDHDEDRKGKKHKASQACFNGLPVHPSMRSLRNTHMQNGDKKMYAGEIEYLPVQRNTHQDSVAYQTAASTPSTKYILKKQKEKQSGRVCKQSQMTTPTPTSSMKLHEHRQSATSSLTRKYSPRLSLKPPAQEINRFKKMSIRVVQNNLNNSWLRNLQQLQQEFQLNPKESQSFDEGGSFSVESEVIEKGRNTWTPDLYKSTPSKEEPIFITSLHLKNTSQVSQNSVSGSALYFA